MRINCVPAVAVLALLSFHCGGDSTRLSHAKLDQDYATRFVGTWEGQATLAIPGQPQQTTLANQRIDSTGFNRLSLAQMCPNLEASAGVDSATTFSMDPLTCQPANESCGPVIVKYDSGVGTLTQQTLLLTLTGSASGCGRSVTFTLTFSGTLPGNGMPDGGSPDAGPAPDGGPADHGSPTAVISARSVEATVGVAVPLDGSGSSDPDGLPLTFLWRVASAPAGAAAPTLTAANSAMPTFTATTEGVYIVNLQVTATDGQNAYANVPVFVHQPLSSGRTFIDLQSDPGDWIGAGGSYSYTKANSQITIGATGGHLSIAVSGDQRWIGDFQMPTGFAQIQAGTYDNLQRYPFNDQRGGLDWSGEGRGCNTLSGSVTVDDVTYVGTSLAAIDLRFEQHCEGGVPALRGRIFWDASDPTTPPGPTAPPAGLWRAPAGATPATGNYVFLQSDSGDYIGQGTTYTYTLADSLIVVSSNGNYLSVRITGDEWWTGDFKGMSSISQLQAGYYGNLERYPFNNPIYGGLDWSGDGRGCNTLSGWFVIDSITYSSGTIAQLDLRFEQHCEDGFAALHGQIHWDASDTTQPPGPIQPPPAGLWTPPTGSTPTSGNYVYLKSDAGDYIGAGGTYTYTPASSTIAVSATGAHAWVTVAGWYGDFQGMSSLSELAPGYYGNLQRYPFHNPARGGLSWDGQGRGCNTLTGWFVVDGLTFTSGVLTALDLRFEQHCEGAGPALHGQIHWVQP